MGGNTSVPPPHAGPSCVGLQCGCVVRGRSRGRVGGKYVSHSLGEVAVVSEEEEGR